ncbi:hypothetical protein [Nocardiopsis xinjiangensis]|uniref:hypothetical protein n=1 Tax=Nocardiopsis xinjiangensis TaxID=124285 RepID=UPI00034D7E91|nr:hypothetical protein [Nocardiopsis xinjiangensis]
MRSCHRPPQSHRVDAGHKENRSSLPSSSHLVPVRNGLRLAAAAALALGATACSGGDAEVQGGADRLHEAQLLQFQDVTQVSEGGESGTYSELTTVQYSAEIRDGTELDKPECVDATNRWGDLDTVQDAPTSVATYEWEEGAVTSLLVQLPPEEASDALHETPPEDCSEYTATYEDGTSSDYSVGDLDLQEMGEESRAHSIDVETDGELSSMISVLYRNDGVLGTTSVIGDGDPAEYEEMLVGFTEAAIDRQNQTLD